MKGLCKVLEVSKNEINFDYKMHTVSALLKVLHSLNICITQKQVQGDSNQIHC